MSINLKLFGKRIVLRREELDMSQKVLSEKIHISPTHLSNIENGKSMPSFGTFIDLCSVLKVNSDYLISGTVYSDINDELLDKIRMCSDDNKIILSKIVDAFIK